MTAAGRRVLELCKASRPQPSSRARQASPAPAQARDPQPSPAWPQTSLHMFLFASPEFLGAYRVISALMPQPPVWYAVVHSSKTPAFCCSKHSFSLFFSPPVSRQRRCFRLPPHCLFAGSSRPFPRGPDPELGTGAIRDSPSKTTENLVTPASRLRRTRVSHLHTSRQVLQMECPSFP